MMTLFDEIKKMKEIFFNYFSDLFLIACINSIKQVVEVIRRSDRHSNKAKSVTIFVVIKHDDTYRNGTQNNGTQYNNTQHNGF
jgi:hypothetical protein